MQYKKNAPYNILCTRDIDFFTLQQVNRFARYWDLIANSGRFKHTMNLILAENTNDDYNSAFQRFMLLTDCLYNRTQSTWKIALPRLYKLLYNVLTTEFLLDSNIVLDTLNKDFNQSNQKGSLEILLKKNKLSRKGVANKRQRNHND